jgi:hypothetical protein
VFWQDFQATPDWILLAMASVHCHHSNHFYHIYRNRTITFQVLSNVDPAVYYLFTNHKAAYYKARLVHQFGSMWLGADFMALGPLAPDFDRLKRVEWFQDSHDENIVAVTAFGPIRAGQHASRVDKSMHQVLYQNSETLRCKTSTFETTHKDALSGSPYRTPTKQLPPAKMTQSAPQASVRAAYLMYSNYLGLVLWTSHSGS